MNLELIGNIFQGLGSITLLYSYIPQISQLIKTKHSKDINTQFWAVLTFGLACISINMYISQVPFFIIFTQILNTILAFITFILVIKYKKN